MITREDVLKVADLARISLKEEEVARLQKDLTKILDYIDQLNALDVTNVPPTSHPLQLKNVYRKDIVQKSLEREKALAIAVDHASGAFKVPKIIE